MNLSIKAFGLKNYLESNNITQFNLDDIIPIFKDGVSSVRSAVGELKESEFIYMDLDPKEKYPTNRYFVKSTKTELTENLLLELGFEKEPYSMSSCFVKPLTISDTVFEIKKPSDDFPIPDTETRAFYFCFGDEQYRNIESVEDLKILFHAITGQSL
jgi:hypothetical protein